MVWLIGYKGLLGSSVLIELKNNHIPFIKTDAEVDFSDYSVLEQFALAQKEINFIINCAGYTNVDKAEDEKELTSKLNITGPKNLALLSNKINATLIHISTDYVFDGCQKSPITEEEKGNPISVYGSTKLAGDDKIINTAKKYYILRTSWLFGNNNKNFVKTMINLFNTKENVQVVNDQFGSPTYSKDLAKVIEKLITTPPTRLPYGIYNFSCNGNISWYDFAREIKLQGENLGLIKKGLCSLSPCTSKEYITAAKRPAYSVLCKDKISKTLNIEIPNWKESLLDYLQSLI